MEVSIVALLLNPSVNTAGDVCVQSACYARRVVAEFFNEPMGLVNEVTDAVD